MSQHHAYTTLATLLFTATAFASPPGRGEPASLLLFPEVDSDPGRVSLVTVTNSDDDFAGGSVTTRWVYVDGESCTKFEVDEVLTPGDTLTVVSGAHAPGQSAGYLYVYAIDGLTGEPIVHNHLIGHAALLDGFTTSQHAVEPYAYLGLGGEGSNADGQLSLDGLQYEMAADEILVPRFFGQNEAFQSYLVLVDLTGGADATTSLSFLVYNDNEEVYSAEHSFTCWERVPLTSISLLFDNAFLASTAQDAQEVVGAPDQEAGWMRIDGLVSATSFQVAEDPAFVAMLVDGVGNDNSSLPLVARGVQGNGSLVPALPNFPDCNANNVPDDIDISSGNSNDCDLNDVPDECQEDCDNDGVPDVCEEDCNGNGVPDDCEDFPDCNANGVPDECDPDADGDGIPDECDLECDNAVFLEFWPPDHSMHSVNLNDLLDPLPHSALPATITVTSITQDESLTAGGGGPAAASCDGNGVGTSTARVRAERAGNGDGRVYEVSFLATGPFGQTCTGSILLTVPRKKNGPPAVDSGQAFDSTTGCP